MSSINRIGQPPPESATGSLPDENSRLDSAMRRADDLLVLSLRKDERRRQLRRTRVILGVTAMLALLGLFSVLLLQSDNKPVDAAPLVHEGWQLWQQQRYDAAADKFQQAVKANPRLTDAWNGLGWSRFNAGHADTAEEAFKRAIELEPNYPAALNGLGQIYFSKNQLDKAEQYLLKAAPSAPAAWWGLGKIYLLQGKWGDASKYLQQIADSGQAQGTDLEDVKLMLDAAHNQNLPDSLRKQISPAYSGSPVAQNVRDAWVAMNQGDTLKARQLFEQALEENPNDANALNGLGWLLIRTGHPDDAKARFEAALKNDPDAAGAMNGLAIVDRQQGNLDDAIAIWEQMVQKYPGVNAGTYGLANAYMTRKEYDKAAALYQQIVAANPDDADSRAQLEKAKSAAAAGN